MWRTIAVWRLLNKLKRTCRRAEVKLHDHTKEAGHGLRAGLHDLEFLSAIAKNNRKKFAKYADYLSLAEAKNMDFIEIVKTKQKCASCGKEEERKWIRLNDKGLEFTSILDLTEYILLKYKLTWTLIASPFVGYFLGAHFG